MISRLEEIRNTMGLNQGEFASKLNMSQSSYSKLIHGSKKIKKDLIDALELLNIDRNWFMTGEGNMFKSTMQKYNSMISIWNELSDEGRNYLLEKAKKLYEMENKGK